MHNMNQVSHKTNDSKNDNKNKVTTPYKDSKHTVHFQTGHNIIRQRKKNNNKLFIN